MRVCAVGSFVALEKMCVKTRFIAAVNNTVGVGLPASGAAAVRVGDGFHISNVSRAPNHALTRSYIEVRAATSTLE